MKLYRKNGARDLEPLRITLTAYMVVIYKTNWSFIIDGVLSRLFFFCSSSSLSSRLPY